MYPEVSEGEGDKLDHDSHNVDGVPVPVDAVEEEEKGEEGAETELKVELDDGVEGAVVLVEPYWS